MKKIASASKEKWQKTLLNLFHKLILDIVLHIIVPFKNSKHVCQNEKFANQTVKKATNG